MKNIIEFGENTEGKVKKQWYKTEDGVIHKCNEKKIQELWERWIMIESLKTRKIVNNGKVIYKFKCKKK